MSPDTMEKRTLETTIITLYSLSIFSLAKSLQLTLGSLRNDDADGNENGKKAMGLDKQNNNFARGLHVLHAFFVHFFAVVARLQRESA